MKNIDWTKISGEEYDWRKTRRPEREYIHDYTSAITYKIFLASRNADGTQTNVVKTFEDALEVIKRIDAMTLGIKKIVYLVGWQYNGHDSKYPAWGEVNAALKSDCDKDARESLIRLMDEGFMYNTVVSLHINVSDAYPDSPLWDEYVERDLIIKNKDGTLRNGGKWGGMQAYYVSLTNEWNSGMTVKRIDELCELLPIERAGTIHIDAFLAHDDPGHGYSLADEQAARNKVLRYFRERGIDATSELVYSESPSPYMADTDHCIGLQPLAYHFSQTLQEYIDRPASLMVGVIASRMFKGWEAASLDALFGGSCDIERKIQIGGDGWAEDCLHSLYFRDFRQKFLNSLERDHVEVTRDITKAYFSGGVVSDSNCGITKNGVPLQGESILLPLVGTKRGKYYYYAFNGEAHSFDMGKAFGIPDGTKFTVRVMTTDGLSDDCETVEVRNGRITLQTDAAEIPLILE